MGKCKGPQLTPNQQLIEDEAKRDERDDAVEELFDEAREMYIDSSKSGFAGQQLDEEGLRNVMRLCYEEWRQK